MLELEAVGGAEGVLTGYLSRLGPASRVTMSGCLARIAGGDPLAFPWHRLRREHTLAIRALLADRYARAPATANKYLAALRGILREAWRVGSISGDDYARAVDLPPVRGNTAVAGRALSARELAALFEFCDRDGIRGARNGAMLALLYGGGLRLAETAALLRSELAADHRSVTLRGKGSKVRTTWLLAGADRRLSLWLDRVAPTDSPPRPVLRPVRRGVVGAGEFGCNSIEEACVRLARRSCIDRFTPHDLRRTFATNLEAAGVPISIIQAQMGHANVATTLRYMRADAIAVEAAAQKVSLP